ncbi:MAG: DUF2723 domain-containing protein [Cytophagales bacterium]|nr:DUF2723 domain-containing protein [Bernardetiaceae bacterium]MDW8210255.1 DUF2723 domain-containing protein [Cytophagales bacterium]
MNYKTLNNATGWVVFLVAFTVYGLTVEDTASFWDCGEFIAVSYKLMVPHPPGAPLFLMLGRMFSFLALGDNLKVAFWINMLSALSSALTILFMFWSMTLLGRKMMGLNPTDTPTPVQTFGLLASAAIGSLAYTFSDSFWFSAVEAEVYGMSSFFTAVVVWAMLKWETLSDEAEENRWLILIAYIMGLSIGVHLLNLVTIPALALIYYFKKYPRPSERGVFATLAVGLFIIGVIMVGIIPGLPSIAGDFEVFFVNSLRLPFGSGALFFAFALIAALVWGIRYSIREQKPLLNTVLLCFAFILIGYSSYALIIIRSNFNPPIDENDPSDVMSFVSYLKREQYGDRPLLYGRTFVSERESVEQGEPIYRKGKDKYEVYDYKLKIKYTKEILLPRMYSNSEDHPELYRQWANIPEGKDPTFWDHMYYMIRYQIGHMYFRYFLWNFAGRDGDEKESGWLLPWSPSRGLPEEVARDKARDNFYMLPLLLGIVGLLYQLKKDEKGFAFVGLLFILMGVALVIYMNSPPVEPRERDYIYVGSFYAFAMWIGFGVLSIAEALTRLIKNLFPATAVATVIGSVVPTIMGVKGWDNHDRSGRYHSVDQARNMLASCAPNAILFTGGDNDTFPLWYVQEVENFRTDVRVIVLSYFNTDWYIEQMRRKVYQSDPLPFSLTYDNYKSGVNDFVPYVENPALKTEAINLKNFLKLVKENNPAIQVELQGGGTTSAIPTKRVFIEVDSAALAQKPWIPKGKAHKVVRRMEFGLRPGMGALYKGDLMLLDLIATNNWERPIYFNNTSANTTAIELREWLHMEGMTYRLMPVRADNRGDLGEVNKEVMYQNVQKFQFRGFDNPKVYHDEEYRKFAANTRNAYYRLAMQFYLDKQDDKAKEILETSLKLIPDKTIPYDYYTPRYAKLFYALNEYERANGLADTLGRRAKENLDYLLRYHLDDFQHSSLKDRSMVMLNQLRSLYAEEAERQKKLADTFAALQKASPTFTNIQSEDVQKAKERHEFFKKKFEEYEEAFKRYYELLYED